MDWNEENLNQSIKEGELQSTSVFYGQSGQMTTLPIQSLRIDKEGVVITEKSWFLNHLKKTTFLWKDKPNIIVETWQPPASAGGRSFYAAYKGVKVSQGHKRFTLDLTPADSPFTYPNKVLEALKKYNPEPIPIFKYKYLLSYGWYKIAVLLPVILMIAIAILPEQSLPAIDKQIVYGLTGVFALLLCMGVLGRIKAETKYA